MNATSTTVRDRRTRRDLADIIWCGVGLAIALAALILVVATTEAPVTGADAAVIAAVTFAVGFNAIMLATSIAWWFARRPR